MLQTPKYLTIAALLLGILLKSAHGFAPRLAYSLNRYDINNLFTVSTSSLLMSIPNPIDTLTSGLVSVCRLPRGVTVLEGKSANDLPAMERLRIKALYDVENNAACRRVREMITELDLVVENVIPAAPGSKCYDSSGDRSYTYMPLLDGMEIPRLVVIENGITERTIVGDDDIVSYLEETFNLNRQSTAEDDTKNRILDILQQVTGYVASLLRVGRGCAVAPTAFGAPRPQQPLILYSYEGNQFCRLVREVLTELDIVYELRNAGKGSSRLSELASLTGGSTQCPYLLDPNTDVAMGESSDITRYLYKSYGRWIPPNEILQWSSDFILPAAKPIFGKLAPLQAGSAGKDSDAYNQAIAAAKSEIEAQIMSDSVVVYTYKLSPFSYETLALLDNLGVQYKEISLGLEWIPGLISEENGSQKRAALLEMTGQSSLPHIFIGSRSIGGLFTGTPGLVPALEQGVLIDMITSAKGKILSNVK